MFAPPVSCHVSLTEVLGKFQTNPQMPASVALCSQSEADHISTFPCQKKDDITGPYAPGAKLIARQNSFIDRR